MKIKRFLEKKSFKEFYYIDGNVDSVVEIIKKYFNNPEILKYLNLTFSTAKETVGIFIGRNLSEKLDPSTYWVIKSLEEYEEAKHDYFQDGYKFMGEIKLDDNGDAYVDDLKVDTDKYNL